MNQTLVPESDANPILDAVERYVRGARQGRDEPGEFDHALWQQALDMGLPLLMVSEDHGGLGLEWQQLAPVLQRLGEGAIALPLAEHVVAAGLISRQGQEPPPGVLSLAPRLREGWLSTATARFSGELLGVPFGRHASQVLAQVPAAQGGALILLKCSDAAACHEGASPAGEARDRLRFVEAPVTVLGVAAEDVLLHAGALLRCCQAAGALQGALDLTLDYARERKQFGKAIGQFQAVQQSLAQFGAEAAAVASSVVAACRAMDAGDAGFAVAAAKLRTNLAIGLGTSTAHQVHAAIGFTREYMLRRLTQRLWQWRSEFGNDRYWSERLGAAVCARGAENFWSDLTARDDAAAAVSA